jgi:hypothetical protein
MPQAHNAGIELSAFFPAESTKRAERYDGKKGKLEADGSGTAIQPCTTGMMAAVSRLLRSSGNERPEHELDNQHCARLPHSVTGKIFAYLADPFDRATLAMTCRILYQRLKPYRQEFALFRHVIATKKRIDCRTQSACMRELSLWLNLFSDRAWTHWRAGMALRNIFTKLGQLYPHVPERIFHELWPLFGDLSSKSATQLVQDVTKQAMARSPRLAVIILTEFARRTVHDRNMGPEFHDKLLDLAVPLWQHPDTAKEAEPLIGAIAQRMEICKDEEQTKRRDEARWKRIVELLPPSASLDSPAVIGLAKSAITIQYHWELRGKRPGIAFPAQRILRDRLGGLMPYSQIKAHAIHAWTPEETEIENRRTARYIASPRYARDLAKNEANRAQFAGHFSGGMPHIETAGGCG